METLINWGPNTWVESRDSGVLKSLVIKIKGWKSINKDMMYTYKVEHDEGTQFLQGIDMTFPADIEEEYNFSIPEVHQTSSVYYLDKHLVHDHSHGNSNDLEWQSKYKEWVKLLNEDSAFQNKIESVKTQLEE